MWAVIPVKSFDQAKQRLAAHLTPPERRALALAMLHDVLAALADARHLSGRLIVTAESGVAELADRYGADVLADQGGGLCSALDQAAGFLDARGARGMVVIPGDVPAITGSTLDAVLADHQQRQRAVSIIPDRDGTGTNCLALSPVTAIPFAFGINSYQAHVGAAQAAGLRLAIHDCGDSYDAFSLDIDTIDDLQLLQDLGPDTRACATWQTFDTSPRTSNPAEPDRPRPQVMAAKS